MSLLSRLRGIFGSGSAIRQAHSLPKASHDSGSFRESLQDWYPHRVTLRSQAAFERDVSSARVDDLYANDGVARSGVNSIATNVIGCGLNPQSVMPVELGLDPKTAVDIQNQMEWFWNEWCGQAHYRGQLGFEDLQMLGLRSLIRHGEMLHLPVMDERPGCRFALRIQDIRPLRLRTPWDKQFDPYIHDGVEVSATGVPLAYWIASPEPSVAMLDDSMFTSSQFVRVPANVGHRRGIFHIFRPDGEEEFRGVSCLAPAIKFFRHFNKSIDYELLAQVLAASFPVFIGLENGTQNLPDYLKAGSDENGEKEEKRYYQEIPPGGIMYGNKGEKPEILESKRPSANFISFCELVQRIMASSLEIPYEVLTKDFSKTTYSSARAALLEAWRVYDVYRSFFVRRYCQPVWQMVQEEAYLRGYLKLPANAPDFYEFLPYWCNAQWNGPARGSIDPLKEANANVIAVNSGFKSRTQVITENGGDRDETFQQLAAEKEMMERLGLLGAEPVDLSEDEDG